MLMSPAWIDQAMFDAVVEQLRATSSPARLDDVRLRVLSEGRCVQTLHVGSFDDEAPVLGRMHHEFIPELGLRVTGKHHEIYFSDSRNFEPSKLRTILRQPVSAA